MSKPIVVLFDDERNFIPGFRPEAIVVRDGPQAVEVFRRIADAEEVIDELWLDFNLAHGAVTDIIPRLDCSIVKKVVFHSSAHAALDLVDLFLRRFGFKGEIDYPESYAVFMQQ